MNAMRAWTCDGEGVRAKVPALVVAKVLAQLTLHVIHNAAVEWRKILTVRALIRCLVAYRVSRTWSFGIPHVCKGRLKSRAFSHIV